MGARVQLKTLEKQNADEVARHLVMAARLIDEDPELAHRHAVSAARRGGRIAVVRESLAITAYASGDFALALRELRTFRRISGSNDQLPLMVDSERGVGRPDRALELGRSVPRDSLPPAVRVGLAIAMSGARLDLGQPEDALGELEIPELDRGTAYTYSPMLFDAYAEVLEELGRTDAAAEWRERSRIAQEALDEDADDDVMTVVEEFLPIDETASETAYDAEQEPVETTVAESIVDDVEARNDERDENERELDEILAEADASPREETSAIDVERVSDIDASSDERPRDA